MLRQQRAGHHCDHSRHRLGGLGLDRLDPGMGKRAAVDGHVQHAGEDDIVQVVPPAPDEPVVFLALDALADVSLERSINSHGLAPRRSGGRLGHRG